MPHRTHHCSSCIRLFCEPSASLGSPLVLLKPRWQQGHLEWLILDGCLAVDCQLDVKGEQVRVVLLCSGALPGHGVPGCSAQGTTQPQALPSLPPDREKGWEQWLLCHWLRDPAHSKETAYRRYLTFSRICFEVLPEEEWHQYFADLLEFEGKLVFGSGYIGLVAE